MNKKHLFEYLLIVMGIYLLITFIEAYLCRPIIDFIGTTFTVYFISYNFLLFIINPIITKLLADLLINIVIEKTDNSNNNV